MVVSVQRLRWDTWNIDHIARHQVKPNEVAEVCEGKPVFSQTYKGRIRVIGPTLARRILTVIIAPEGDDSYYAITARPASRQERRLYANLGGEVI